MKKNQGFVILTIICVLFVGEVFSYLGLIVLRDFKGLEYENVLLIENINETHQKNLRQLIDESFWYLQFDSDLGWSIKPKGLAKKYKANEQGIRSTQNYASHPEEGRTRVAAFGDSYTHSDEVYNHEMWTSLIEQKNPELEVLNFGVGGYGLDQAYLRYKKEVAKYHPDIVLIGFMNEDIHRHVNNFRPFYNKEGKIPLSKPRFVLDQGELRLLENPFSNLEECKRLLQKPRAVLKELAKNDFFQASKLNRSWLDVSSSVKFMRMMIYHYKQRFTPEAILMNGRYNPQSEAFQITVRLFDMFYDDVQKRGMEPIIVLFPDGEFLRKYLHNGFKEYAPLIDYFKEKGYRYIDLSDGFLQYLKNNTASIDSIFQGHYNALGNAVAASLIAEELLA